MSNLRPASTASEFSRPRMAGAGRTHDLIHVTTARKAGAACCLSRNQPESIAHHITTKSTSIRSAAKRVHLLPEGVTASRRTAEHSYCAGRPSCVLGLRGRGGALPSGGGTGAATGALSGRYSKPLVA